MGINIPGNSIVATNTMGRADFSSPVETITVGNGIMENTMEKDIIKVRPRARTE
jgi:hypothetical protein